MAVVEIMKNTVCHAFELMSVVNPLIFFEPVPQTYHWLEGFHGRQFSASVAFLGALHVAKAETARSECASVSSRIRWRASRFPDNAGGRPFAASRIRRSRIRAEFARRNMKKKSWDVAFTQFARFMAQPSLTKMGSGLVPRASLWHAYSKTSKLLSAKDCSINQVRPRISNPGNSLIQQPAFLFREY